MGTEPSVRAIMPTRNLCILSAFSLSVFLLLFLLAAFFAVNSQSLCVSVVKGLLSMNECELSESPCLCG